MLIYKPKMLDSLPGITAGFTSAGREKVNVKGQIPGFNFGDNTTASDKEIKAHFDRLFQEIHHGNGIVIADQVHGNKVKVVQKPGFYPDIDGFVTSTPNLLLGIKVADCAAVLIADPENEIVAAAHAGWRGAVAGILPNTLNIMKSEGADISKTAAYISPCISRNNFEVGDEVAEKFPDFVVYRSPGLKPHIDLKAFLSEQLTESGISRDRIEVDERCTVANNRFYSFRRERDRAGRMLGFIKYSQK